MMNTVKGGAAIASVVITLSGCLLAKPEHTYDIVVYGATPGGIATAVQAAEMGRRVALIEPSARIGGMTTGGLGATDFGNLEAIQGLARRFYRDVRTWYRDPSNWKHENLREYVAATDSFALNDGDLDIYWRFEPSAALAILERWVSRDGIDLFRRERLDRVAGGVTKEGGRIVSFRTESGLVFRATVFVDATYEGDLMAAAGVSYAVGRESESEFGEILAGVQTKRGLLKLQKGIDPYVVPDKPESGLLPYVEPKAPPDGTGGREIQAFCFRMCLTDKPENRIPFALPEGFDIREYELLFRNFAAGDDPENPPWLNDRMPNRKTDTNNTRGFATDYVGANWNWPEASYEERDRIFADHLRYQQGLMWVLANHVRVPKKIREEVSRWGVCRDEFTESEGWPTQLYVREARRMRGEYVMTEKNCIGERVAPNPVALGSYGLDSHNVRRYVTDEGFVQNEGELHWNEDTPKERIVRVTQPYPIDYGAIVPKKAECENLIVPVCISATHVAFGSIRMEPVYFALGQAAGTAAGLACLDGRAVQDVDYTALRARLLADGQIISWKCPDAFRLADAIVGYEDSFATDSRRVWGRLGAEDLASGLSKVTGSNVRAVSESEAVGFNGPVIWVGNTRAARAAGLDVQTLSHNAYRIKVDLDRAFVVASAGVGANDGCVRFLERQAGYYMVSVSGVDPYKRDANRRAVVCDILESPVIYNREIAIENKRRFPETTKMRLDSYLRRLGCGLTQEAEYWVSKEPWQCHTFYNYCRPEDWFATHPEFFSMGRDGKRAARWNNGTELCLSAPGLLDVVYASLVKFIEADRREYPDNPPRIYEFSQMDNCDSLCWCQDCRRTIAKYNRVAGGHKEGGDSGLLLEFVNRLARKVKKAYPDVMLRTFAYVSTEGVPVGIRPEGNVIVRLCDLYSSSDHMLPLEHPINLPRLRLLEDWVRVAPNLEVWDYRLYGNTTWEGVFPEVDVDAIAADMRLFAKLGIKRILVEHQFDNQPFFELNAFVESRLSRNPHANVDDLVKIYCGVYGAGSEEMRQAIGLLRSAIRDNPPSSIEDWHSRILPWRNAEVLGRIGKLVSAAYRRESAGTVARGRIAEVLASVILELARLYKVMPGKEAEFDKSRKAAIEFFNEGIRVGAVHPGDVDRETARFKSVLESMELRFNCLPDELKNVPRGELVCFDQSCAYIERKNCDKNIQDALSEVGSATKFRPLDEPSRPIQGTVWRGAVVTTEPFAFDPIPDGRYHWYRLGTIRCKPSTQLYVPNGGPCYRMKDVCIPHAGSDDSLNIFDVWVSAKLVGNAVSITDKTKGLFTDRLLLRRLVAGE